MTNRDESPTDYGEADQPTLPDPTNVIAALARVEAEIGGISKLSPREHAERRGQRAPEKGITYSYRGIDQIAQAAQPKLGRYGVVIVPMTEHHVVDEITVNGKPWTDTTVTVRWNIYGPGGVDDRIEALTVGMGRDNADKGYNKAYTGAYKNLLLRILSIGDPQDDSDHERHERDGVDDEPEPQRAGPHHDRAVAAIEELRRATDDVKADVKALATTYDKDFSTAATTIHELANDESFLAVVEGVLANGSGDGDSAEGGEHESPSPDGTAADPEDAAPVTDDATDTHEQSVNDSDDHAEQGALEGVGS